MELQKIKEDSVKIRRLLNQVKEITIDELIRKLNLTKEEVMLAVGWLAHDNNISIEKQGCKTILSNQPEYDFSFG